MPSCQKKSHLFTYQLFQCGGNSSLEGKEGEREKENVREELLDREKSKLKMTHGILYVWSPFPHNIIRITGRRQGEIGVCKKRRVFIDKPIQLQGFQLTGKAWKKALLSLHRAIRGDIIPQTWMIPWQQSSGLPLGWCSEAGLKLWTRSPLLDRE